MATFTIDLISGRVFLFNKDFSSSGGTTPTGGTSTYPEVNTVAELPPANLNNGKTYLVRTSTGNYIINRQEAGLWFSTGTVWRRLGDIPSFFLSDNFQIVDSSDSTKGIEFETSGITTNIFRKVKIQDGNGTIAYLTDLDGKVDLSAFNDYTGTTAPNTYLAISDFNTYSGETYALIQNKQDILTAGKGINISGNTISVDVPRTLQLIDQSGNTEINTIPRTPIIWSTVEYSGTSLFFSGGSSIYILDDGEYEISYSINYENQTNGRHNIGSLIMKNSTMDITPLSSASYIRNAANKSGTNSMSPYKVDLSSGDYIELMTFRIGSSGSVLTVPKGSWIKIIKIL
jgi:hypothetical protein